MEKQCIILCLPYDLLFPTNKHVNWNNQTYMLCSTWVVLPWNLENGVWRTPYHVFSPQNICAKMWVTHIIFCANCHHLIRYLLEHVRSPVLKGVKLRGTFIHSFNVAVPLKRSLKHFHTCDALYASFGREGRIPLILFLSPLSPWCSHLISICPSSCMVCRLPYYHDDISTTSEHTWLHCTPLRCDIGTGFFNY